MRTAPALLVALALATPAPAGPPRADPDGFPLPAEAVRRLGSARFRHPQPVLNFRVRPDGKVVYTTDGKSIYGWDLATGRRRFITPGAHGGVRWADLGCTATRLRVVAAEHGYIVTDLDPETGHVLGKAKPVHVGQYGSVVLSPDGEWLLHFVPPTADELAKAPGRSWVRVRVSDAAGARPPADLGEVNSPYFARFSRDGTVFAVTGPQADGPIRAFDPRTGALLREWSRSGVHLQYFGSADHAFTAWSQKPGELALKSWDAKTGGVRTLLGGYPHPAVYAIAPGDGVLAAQATPDWHDWQFTDLAAGKQLGRLPVAGYPAQTFGEFAPGGKTFVTLALGTGGRSHVVAPWEVATGKPTAAGTYPCDAVTGLRSAGGGRLLGAADGRVLAWDAGTGAVCLHGAVLDREGWVSSDAWDVRADGVRVARTKRVQYPEVHTRVTIADAATGEVRAAVGARLPGGVTVLAFSADGGRLFWADPNEGVVTEWDLAADRAVAERKAARVVRQLRASPDGRWLAGLTVAGGQSDGPWEAIVWDLRAAGQPPRVMGCPGAAWVRTEFTGRGALTVLGCGAAGFTARTWDLTGGREVWRASVPLPPGFRPGAPAALSPDGGTLAVALGASGSGVYRVQLIELFTGRPRHSFAGHFAPVTGLEFTGDGRLASAGQDAPVYLWDIRGELTRPPDPPDRAALEGAWDDLGSADPAVGFRAVRLLAAFPDRSVPFLAGRLPPAAEPDPARFAALVAALDAARYADRERAMQELAGLGRPAERAMRKALASAGSAEVRSRLEGLLARLPDGKLTADDLRAARAVEVVGWAGTPKAAELLAKWAGGVPAAPLTTEAARAAKRLTR